MLRVSFFLILWNLICSLVLTAQEYSYVNYNTREGLAGSVVYCVVQDNDGFMWFGTETGLSRFDGTRFRNFTTADGLPDNEIIRLFVDSKNRIWIAPFKNTVCYYWHGKIYNAENDSTLSRLKLQGEVYAMTESSEGDIGILQLRGVSVIGKSGKVLNMDNVNNIPVISGFWAGPLENGSLGFEVSAWKTGIYQIQVARDSVRAIKYVGPTGNHYQTLYHSKNLQIKRKMDSLKIILPLKGEEINIVTPPQFTSFSYLNDSLVSLNSSRVNIINTRLKKTERVLLDGKQTSMVIIDRENNFWFATQGDGVYKLASLEYKNYFLREHGNGVPVFSVLKSGDTIYAGSSGSKIYIINSRTDEVKGRVIDLTSSTPGRVITLNKLQSGPLLAGTDHAFIKIDGSKIEKAKDVYSSVKSVHLSGDSLVIGQSIATILLNANHLTTLDTIWQGRTTAVLRKQDQYFIGTLQGLYIVDANQKNGFAENKSPILKSRVSAICEDQNGNVWIATNGSGVAGYRDGRIFIYINKNSGLSSNICRSIFTKGSYLWIGTEQGLNKVDLKNNDFVITRYSTSDGLVSNVINGIWIDSPMVYLATPKGISFFDESKVNTHSMCALKITAIQSAAHRWPFDTSGVVFAYNDRDIRIEFVGISFKSAGEINYRYLLSGVHDEWQQSSDNFLNYAALPPGAYDLKLQAINKFGVASDIKTLRFIIEKPFWEKTWFRLLIILLLGAAVWKFLHYRIQSERKKQAQKDATNRKMSELEQMALKAQMNPHFIFNSLHSIQQYVMDKDIKGANKFITDFARLIRLTLNISMKPKISLYDEINYLSTYLELEKTRLETKFDYSVDVAENIDVESNFIPAMILQPHVENSIRHGVNNRSDKEGFIKVKFHIEKDYLVCTVEDNGIGRSATNAMKGEFHMLHQSRGMSLTQNRIELLNKHYETPILSEIEDVHNSGNIAGTKVTVSFPISEVKKPV